MKPNMIGDSHINRGPESLSRGGTRIQVTHVCAGGARARTVGSTERDRTGAVGWLTVIKQEGINFARMREERAARAKQVLKREGVPAILVTGESNVRDLTGFSWPEFQPGPSHRLFFADFFLRDEIGPVGV